MSQRLGSYDPPDYQTPAEQRTNMLYGGIWLVFMVWPLVTMVTSDAAVVWKVMGVLALAAFIAVYLFGLLHPKLFENWTRLVNTLIYTAVLTAFLALAMVSAGVYVLTSAGFIMALWLFSYRLLPGTFAALLIAMVAITTGYIADPNHLTAALDVPVGMTFIILILVRISTERDELDRQLSEQLALSKQREELGRTVHDVLGHSLTAITVNAQLARRLVRTDPAGAEEQLDHVLATARTALGEVRHTVTALSQPDLAEQLSVTRTILKNAGIAVVVPKESDLPELPDHTQELFAWCLREGVTNVVRHSGAHSCAISVGESGVRIDDDGTGLAAPESLGLRGLRVRVEEAGGTLSVANHPDHSGTRMEVRI